MNRKKEYDFGTINIKKYAITKLRIVCEGNNVTQTDLINELLDYKLAVRVAVLRIRKHKEEQHRVYPTKND